jgi:chemotaxis protein histidine kinase CheA
MADPVHLLVVRAGGVAWGLPMAAVEQTFDLRDHEAHRVGTAEVVCFRGQVLELVNLADRLGVNDERRTAAMVVWASGRRRAFAVQELVGQLHVARLEMPGLAGGDFASGVVLHDGDVIPILEPGAIAGAWSVGDTSRLGFSELQRSALGEIGAPRQPGC